MSVSLASVKEDGSWPEVLVRIRNGPKKVVRVELPEKFSKRPKSMCVRTVSTATSSSTGAFFNSGEEAGGTLSQGSDARLSAGDSSPAGGTRNANNLSSMITQTGGSVHETSPSGPSRGANPALSSMVTQQGSLTDSDAGANSPAAGSRNANNISSMYTNTNKGSIVEPATTGALRGGNGNLGSMQTQQGSIIETPSGPARQQAGTASMITQNGSLNDSPSGRGANPALSSMVTHNGSASDPSGPSRAANPALSSMVTHNGSNPVIESTERTTVSSLGSNGFACDSEAAGGDVPLTPSPSPQSGSPQSPNNHSSMITHQGSNQTATSGGSAPLPAGHASMITHNGMGDSTVMLEFPAAAERGPFFQYLSTGLAKEVLKIYFREKIEAEEDITPVEESELIEFVEGAGGAEFYPFLDGMQLYVDVIGGKPNKCCNLM